MMDTRNWRQGSSAFLYTNKITFVSYCKDTSKTKKKLMYLMSTMHTRPTIMENGKLEIMSFYNETKGGVDTETRTGRLATGTLAVEAQYAFATSTQTAEIVSSNQYTKVNYCKTILYFAQML
ncbi:hypothetical protein Pmani_006481 [Petrolisthes manimaculis]|uniref:Uncharacterized protein n=1 Tax=Petrolisthes manimaculis TaxID=1843537 RepID=A0AAE1QA97_9EUCA|nr:hypothetical protein Pmani_006481 [Petrolisthes manimaculis]